jgi:hypothetical protein
MVLGILLCKGAINYIYTVFNGLRCSYFKRKALKLHSSISALSIYLETKYKIFKETDPRTANTNNPTILTKYLKQKKLNKDNNPTFKEALINWIIYDY